MLPFLKGKRDIVKVIRHPSWKVRAGIGTVPLPRAAMLGSHLERPQKDREKAKRLPLISQDLMELFQPRNTHTRGRRPLRGSRPATMSL